MSSSGSPATQATSTASPISETTLGRTPGNSYASTLKRVVQTFKPAGLTSTPTIPPYKILRSYSANAMVADFSGFQLTMAEAFSIIQSQFPQAAGIKFLKQGKAAEIQFLSTPNIQQALHQGLTYSNRTVPLTRCFSPESIILPITVRGLPCFLKDDTYIELQKAFSSFGVLKEVKFHYYGTSNIRMDSCTVMLDISAREDGCCGIPRQMRIHGAPCDLFWRDAPAFCRYCKQQGHIVKKCPKLERRKGKTNQISSLPTTVSDQPPSSQESVDIPLVRNHNRRASLPNLGNPTSPIVSPTNPNMTSSVSSASSPSKPLPSVIPSVEDITSINKLKHSRSDTPLPVNHLKKLRETRSETPFPSHTIDESLSQSMSSDDNSSDETNDAVDLVPMDIESSPPTN
jgi:hypothetical protein